MMNERVLDLENEGLVGQRLVLLCCGKVLRGMPGCEAFSKLDVSLMKRFFSDCPQRWKE